MDNRLRIVFTGPESTGKSTLSRICAKRYGGLLVDEYSRIYIDSLSRPYEYQDLTKIAHQQVLLELKAEAEGIHPIFQDTDLLTLKIWSLFKYGRYNEWFEVHLQSHLPNLYFLCGIDVPWEADVQREHPHPPLRSKIYDLYKEELKALKTPFYELSGTIQNRLEQVEQQIDKLRDAPFEHKS